MNPDTFQPDRTTVGEVVANNYHAAGIFKAYGLDFCCGGGETIASACAKREIDADEVISKLRNIPWKSVSAGENFQAWEPSYLIDHIVEHHHRFVREKSLEIEGYAAKVARVHGERHPENIEIYNTFMALAAEMESHMNDEEQRAFPLIQSVIDERASGKVPGEEMLKALREELDQMVSEHEEAGDLMAKIRELTRDFNPPAEACATWRILYQNLEGFEDDLHKHVHLENNILFRKAEKLL